MTVIFDPEYYTVTRKVERKNKEGQVISVSREYDLKSNRYRSRKSNV